MTGTLAVATFWLPETIEKLTATRLELRTALEIRIGAVLLVLLFGTFIILTLVLFYCHALKKKLQEPQKTIKTACASVDPPPRRSITGRRWLS